MNRKTVVIGGSRSISKLSKVVVDKINEFMNEGYNIVIGDANGVDKQVQYILARRNYKKIKVFCVEGTCRNNVENWEVEFIKTDKKRVSSFFRKG